MGVKFNRIGVFGVFVTVSGTAVMVSRGGGGGSRGPKGFVEPYRPFFSN